MMNQKKFLKFSSMLRSGLLLTPCVWFSFFHNQQKTTNLLKTANPKNIINFVYRHGFFLNTNPDIPKYFRGFPIIPFYCMPNPDFDFLSILPFLTNPEIPKFQRK